MARLATKTTYAIGCSTICLAAIAYEPGLTQLAKSPLGHQQQKGGNLNPPNNLGTSKKYKSG
jgi:hypothetical protein